MSSLPELLEEDVREIEATLRDFLARSEATLALITAEGGFLVMRQGEIERFDSVTLGALAANAYNASQAIAGLLGESNFTHIYQEGQGLSLLVSGIDPYNTLVVFFPSQVSVGSVKYFAAPALEAIARQFKKASERPSNRGIDLAMLNVADSSELFQRKAG